MAAFSLLSVASSAGQIFQTHAMNGWSGRGRGFPFTVWREREKEREREREREREEREREREREREGERGEGGRRRRRRGGTMPNKVRILHFGRRENVFLSGLF